MKGRKFMSEILTIVLVVVGWLVLTQLILPKLGVPT
jgi:hypothetical protein